MNRYEKQGEAKKVEGGRGGERVVRESSYIKAVCPNDRCGRQKAQ